MDDRAFDHFTRLLGSGASRRRVLKGLLGIGATAVAADSVDARTIGGRPTIPPPAPPTTTLPPTTPPPLCASGLEQCPGSEVCCTPGTCARSGNQAICCDGSSGYGSYLCGLECCADGLACCDGECCSNGSVCLGQVYAGSGFEEFCCPEGQTCGGGCCDGTCYIPPDSGASWFDRSCCAPGMPMCDGTGDYGNTSLCCGADTTQCCTDSAGGPVCLTAGQCCIDDECAGLTNPAACEIGVCRDFTCTTASGCPEGSACCSGFDNTCCPVDERCCSRGQESVRCLAASQCCDDADCTEFARSYCDLTTDQCTCTPLTCDDVPDGACGSIDNGCGGTLDCSCDTDQQCCQDDSGNLGVCKPDPGCCSDSDCTELETACSYGVCTATGQCEYTDCQDGLDCCVRLVGDDYVGTCIDPEQQCCSEWDCAVENYEGCVTCDDQFTCQPANEGERCYECRVCQSGLCAAGPDGGECENWDNASPYDGICCEGYCADTESCEACNALGTSCETSGDCCSGNCCNELCIDPYACCYNDECGECGYCTDQHTCEFACQFGNDCCWSGIGQTCDETLNDGNGLCVACAEAEDACSTTQGPGCCEGLTCCGSGASATCCDEFCIDNVCQNCVPLNRFGCSEDDDCCSGACRSGACICFNEREGNCTENDHCCGDLVCADTASGNHSNYCLTSCISDGGRCGPGLGYDCCAGHRCTSTDGTNFFCRPY